MDFKRLKPPPYSTPAGLKECGKCRKELPANTDFFDKDKSKTDGLKGWCKQCRQAKKDLERNQHAAQMLETLDKTVMANLAKAKPGGSAMPHATEIYQCLMGMVGGPQGFAMHWAATFIASKPGSMTRERMLSALQKLAVAVSEDGKVNKPTELLSTEELQAELDRREKEMVSRTVIPISVSETPRDEDFDLPQDRSPHECPVEPESDRRAS